jgi:hypothetical protein
MLRLSYSKLTIFSIAMIQIALGWEPPAQQLMHEKSRHSSYFGAVGKEWGDPDIATGSQFKGLLTYANLPYVNCLADDEVEHGSKYDIAILGAPFDTVSNPSTA